MSESDEADGTSCTPDTNECTKDICQNGSCEHPNKPDETPCAADGTICTRDVCFAGNCGVPTHENEPCESDNNICSVDLCEEGICGHDTPIGNGTPCAGDGDLCTYDVCLGTTCDHPPKCPESDGPCIKECCDTGVCITDVKAQPCAFIDSDDGAGCRGETVVLRGTFCNNGTCTKSFSLSGQQTGGPVILENLTPSGGVTMGPQSCVTLSVTADIAAHSPPGTATVQLTASSQSDGTCDPLVTRSCGRLSTVTVYVVDLDGDENHDGVIESGGTDDALENALPGVITLCNVDDDNEDGVRDNEGTNAATIDDGAGVDGNDLAEVVLRAMPNLPQNWTVKLTLHTPANTDPAAAGAGDVVRVFSDQSQTANTLAILGPGTTSFALPNDQPHDVDLTALRADDVSIWVEGLQFAAQVKLRMILEDDMGTFMCDDEIQLKVAPFILVPTTAIASRLIVTDDDPTFLSILQNLAGAANTIVPSVNDQWPQDAWEFGFSSMPLQASAAAFETLRAGSAPDLQSWGRTALLGPTPTDPNRTGLIKRQAELSKTLAFGGNLEVTPPLADDPLGRIIVGTMPQIQKDYLIRQGVQTPLIELDTTWLKVGHIDELMAIIPGSQAGSWDIAWASPDQAMLLLAGVAAHEPLFYCDIDDVVITGQATSGTADTLVDTNANFVGEPFFQWVRIYEGTGRGQIARIDPGGITATSVRISEVWFFGRYGRLSQRCI